MEENLKHCLTCDGKHEIIDTRPVFFTIIDSNQMLVSDVLERCLLTSDLTKLTSDVICSKCFLLLEEYCAMEVKYMELKNQLWSMHKQTLSNRKIDMGELIRGIEVQTEDFDNNSNCQMIFNELDENRNIDDDNADTDENLTVDADPQIDSEDDEESHSSHEAKMTYPCNVCGLTLYTKEALNVHQIVFKHRDGNLNTVEEADINGNLKQTCSVCNKTFNGYSLLRRHVISEHSNHRLVYKCRTCYKELTTQGGAEYHGRSHYVGGDDANIEDIFSFLVQPTRSKKPRSSSKHTITSDSLKTEEEFILKEEVDVMANGNSSSDDEVPLAAKRKQIIFSKIQKEVLTAKKSEEKPVSKTAKKALAELQKINGIVIEKVVKKDQSSKLSKRDGHAKDMSLIRRIIKMQNHLDPNQGEGEDNVESGDEGMKEVRLPPIKEAKFECEHCHKKWKTRGELNAHTSTHSDARPYICEMCGQAYKHKHALDVHVGMHKGIYQHQCPYCQKAFTQKGALQRHLPIHTGELPFQCELCGKRFVHRTSFSIHTMAHTGVRHIRCQICNLGVLSKSHLRRHMRIHSGEKPYECSFCGKAFAERYNLVAHRRTHDPTSPAPRVPRRKQHVCRLCNVFYCSKQKLEEHMINDHHKVVDESAALGSTDAEPANTYLPSRFQAESERSKATSQRSNDDKAVDATPEQLVARRNLQALRNADLLRTSVDGPFVRLSTGMIEPSQAWAYLNHAT